MTQDAFEKSTVIVTDADETGNGMIALWISLSIVLIALILIAAVYAHRYYFQPGKLSLAVVN